MLPAVKQLLAFQMASQPVMMTGPFAKDKPTYGAPQGLPRRCTCATSSPGSRALLDSPSA